MEKKNKGFLTSISEFIVNKYLIFFFLFIAMMIFSVFSMGWVETVKLITDYLPDSAEGKQGLQIMYSEYVTYDSCQVMVNDISYEKALSLSERLSEMEGVALLSFDDTADHYKDGYALFDISFLPEYNTDEMIGLVKDKIGDGYEVRVGMDEVFHIYKYLLGEIGVAGVLAGIVVVCVLLFTSQTYGEILVLLLTFVAAAVINMGTNFIMGKISLVSYAVAIILQLALSVDYAIILCNRYKEEHQNLPMKEALIKALSASMAEVSASSLTTIAGLMAMTFMEFKLGLDMGLVLIKAIIIAILSVFFFMPALIVIFSGLIDKTHHRNFVPKISFVGRLAYKTRKIIPPIFVGIVIIACLLFNKSNYAYSMQLVPTAKQNELSRDNTAIAEKFGYSNVIAVLVPSGDYETERALTQELESLSEVKSAMGIATIEAMDGYTLADCVNYHDFASIANVDDNTAQALFAFYAAETGDYRDITDTLEDYEVPLVDIFLALHDKAQNSNIPLTDEQIDMIDDLYSQLKIAEDQLQGRNHSRILLYVDLAEQGDETFAFIDRVHVIAKEYYKDGAILAGNSVSAYDFYRTFRDDIKTVSITSIVLVMVILLFTFKSFALPIILVIVIQGSIWINFAIPAFSQKYVFFMCFLIVSAIQMGANIDYAIVISSRYLELRNTMGKEEAITETMNLCFPTVMTSGLMMVGSGLFIGNLVSQCVVAGMGLYVGTGTIITLCLVHFVLPQVLLLCDGVIRGTVFKLPANAERAGRRRKLCAGVMACVSMLSLGLMPAMYSETDYYYENTIAGDQKLYEYASELSKLAVKLRRESETTDSVKLGFAEQLITDKVGTVEYEEGAAQYEDGEEQITKGRAAISSGESKLAEGRRQYAEAEAQVNSGRAQLAAAQAEYDAAAAQLEAGKQELEAGKAQLASVEPLYNTAMSATGRYQSAQAKYDAAVASGDTVSAALLGAELAAAKALYETEISNVGSLSSLTASYQAAQAQIAAGEAQVAQGEAQLASAKAQLDAGYAELADGEAQLASAKAQLDAGEAQLSAAKAQLAEGEKKLAEAKVELDEGKEFLDENRDALQSSLSGLDEISDERERLEKGVDILLEDPNIYSLAGIQTSDAEVCRIAEEYIGEKVNEGLDKYDASGYILSALLAAIALAIVAAIVSIRKPGGAVAPSAIAAIAAALAATFWKIMCSGIWDAVFWVAAALAVIAAICSDAFSKMAKAE